MPACAGASSYLHDSKFYQLEQTVEGNRPRGMRREKAFGFGLPVTGTRRCVKNR